MVYTVLAGNQRGKKKRGPKYWERRSRRGLVVCLVYSLPALRHEFTSLSSFPTDSHVFGFRSRAPRFSSLNSVVKALDPRPNSKKARVRRSVRVRTRPSSFKRFVRGWSGDGRPRSLLSDPTLAPCPPWAEAPFNPTPTWRTSSNMKRNLSSDMDSDCDDLFEDSSSKGTPTPSSDSCQLVNRKRRRGIIEKRRRDRINHSLSELRRLVPAAFEKQGSAKLEKAEILQMTVDHLKMLHAKGFDALTFDPHKFAMDYHNIGFRECASEVARYMVAIEGMDLQDPLRLRLMSHLQCYSAQRELAMKTSSVHSSPWSPASSTSVSNPVGPPTGPPAPSIHHQYSHNPTGHVHPHHGSGSLDIGPPPSSLSHASYNCSESRLHHPGDGLASLNNNNPNNFARMGSNNPQSVAPTSVPHTFATSGGGVSSQMMPSIGQMPGNQYLTGHGFGAGPYANHHHHQSSQGSSVKPYRPWGAELAY